MSVRAAVVGCGAIAKEHLSFLSTDHRVDLVGVCDTSPATAEYTAALYNTTPYTDLVTMLETAVPQVVHVLTPPMSHPTLVRICLDAGADVVCEKPIAISSDELDGLLAYAAERGRTLIESQNLRFNEEVLELHSRIDAGTLGTVTSVEIDVVLGIAEPGSRFADTNVPSAVKDLPGGAIHDFLPHMTYLMVDLLGWPTLESAQSRWHNRSANDHVAFDDMEAMLQFGSATTGRMRFSSRENPPRFTVTVRGTAGTAAIDFFNPYLTTDRSFGTAQLDGIINSMMRGAALFVSGPRNLKDKILQHGAYHGFPPMLGAFYDSVAQHTAPPITPDEMRLCLAVIDAVTKEAVRS